MTTKVTKESLQKRIKSIDATERCVGLSLQAEYNREVYRMLLSRLQEEAEFNDALDAFEDEE